MNMRIKVKIGKESIGGRSPIKIQSMTSTPTEDVLKTVKQINQLVKAGSEMVRVTVNNKESAKSVVKIKEKLIQMGIDTPLIGDFHYNGDKLLSNNPDCATSLDKYRINPGNVGYKSQKDKNFARIIEIACKYRKPVRIGVNWGSLDQEYLAKQIDANLSRKKPLTMEKLTERALIASAINSATFAKKVGLSENKIVLSCKTSNIPLLLSIYKQLYAKCRYPLHIGLTEAGMGLNGTISSTVAMAILLNQGIGDTLRISLTPGLDGDRTQEVKVAKQILQSLEIRKFHPVIVSCPGCGRTSSNYFQQLTKSIQDWVEKNISEWKIKYPGVENITIAVMGCVVNGPGESKNANIGISLPGTGENPVAVVYQDGERLLTLKGKDIIPKFTKIIQNYISTFGSHGSRQGTNQRQRH